MPSALLVALAVWLPNAEGPPQEWCAPRFAVQDQPSRFLGRAEAEINGDPNPVTAEHLAQPPAIVRFRVRPNGARICLNGAPVEHDAEDGHGLWPGLHEIRIQHPARLFGLHRFRPESRTIEIENDTTIEVSLVPAFGVVTATAPRQEVILELEALDRALALPPLELEAAPARIELPVGRYEAELLPIRSYYETVHEQVTVRPGVETSLTAELALLPAFEDRFVVVPSGPARLGLLGREESVSIDEYLIGRHEVTIEEYAAYVSAGGRAPSGDPGCNWGQEGKDRHPVNCVTHDDARNYAQWLSRQEPELEYRLPTEEQWEKAARGATGQTYPWGDEPRWDLVNLCDIACSEIWAKQDADDGYAATAPVGMFANASPYGAFDMLGNVAERTLSGPLRGGSFSDFLNNLQTYKPHGVGPLPTVGLRLVVVAPRRQDR